MGVFYPYASQDGLNLYEPQSDAYLVGYADGCYISDPHRTCSQIGYVFTMGNTIIS